METRRQRRQQRLERKTARVFFSSPFGGLEEEREELTKKYWPQLDSLCSKAGYEFIPVDLRWGITSEMSSSAVTIKICLSEMDRSDMIVGFFGQRYGWHGDNELLQKSFDVAAEKYPWLNEYRDRSVTEVEYLHGHLRDPGARPACFFFRDKEYDDKKLEEALKTGEEWQIRKFRASTDGPNASTLLDNLKKRIDDTGDKCLAVHANYKTPQEGARLMFDTIHKYLKDVLLASPVESLTTHDVENVQHDVFLASKKGMGGAYVGGAKYLELIDKHVSLEVKGATKPIIVLGNAGIGKSCLLSNWATKHQENSPLDIVIYHFVGSSSESTVPATILSRLVNELFEEINELRQNNNRGGPVDESLKPGSKDKVEDLTRKLRALTEMIKETGPRVFIIVDALNKVDVTGQTMKALYWLPKILPANVNLLLSTLTSDAANIQELEDRGCETITIQPLEHEHREQIALATLKIRGKTLSTEQRERIFKKQQTENPLYLKTLLQELLSFGEFFQLDAYIDDLLKANDFAYDELAEAVEERYCENKEKRKEFIWKLADYFANKLKDIGPLYDSVIPPRVKKELPWLLAKYGDKDRLAKFILRPTVYYSYRYGQDQYEFASYWHATGLTGEDIVAKQQKEIDDQLTLCYNDASEKGEDHKNVPEKIIALLFELAQFLEKAGYTNSVEPLFQRALQMQKGLYGEDKIQEDAIAAKKYLEIANSLACLYTSTEQFDKAEDLHREVLHLKQKFVNNLEDGVSSLAVTLNNLGAMCHRQNKHKEGEEFYSQALEKHREANSGYEDIADVLNNLGITCWSLGKYEEARKYLEEALKLYDEAFFGELPPDVGGTLLNLAMVYRRMDGMEDKAAPLYLRALEIRENAYGADHHEVGQTLLSYSAFLLYKDTATSIEVSKRAADIYEKSLGLSHISTLNALENVALAYLIMQQPSEAHPYFKKAGVQKALLGRMETSIPKLNAVMADYYLNSGQNEEARELFSRVVTASFATDRDFAALDFLDNALPKEERPTRKREETVEYGIEKFPKSPMLLGRLQEKYSANGDSISIIKVLEKGEFDVEQYNLAYQNFNGAGHKKEGMNILMAANKIYPNDKIIMFNLGSAYAYFKDHKQACVVLKRLLEVDAEDLDALELYARMLSLSGRPHEGKDIYAKALKVAEQKNNKEALERLNAAVKLMNEM